MPTNELKSSLLFHRYNHPATNTCPKQQSQQQQPHPQRSPLTCATPVPNTVSRYHAHAVGPNQCCFVVTQQISAVWPIVRRFDNPQAYKHFVKSCHAVNGDGSIDIVKDDAEELVAGEDEDTGALVALIVKFKEVTVTTGEEDEDTVLDLYLSISRVNA
ncbi:hypothetical protein RHSIM_Rhsim01G0176700 [Rhododendron simsii]|uniref:Uncharacterized protein n=1 Tax=Rhododendron simsii TaxID=118357 RepID=A0A834HSW3_RHOSS|nr:hypothetical protein RHSIM_Rhsim01G0176700 [Rhododendron simsii]